jgi:hypothetical protein
MNPQMLNPVLQAFFLKQEKMNATAPAPNPEVNKKKQHTLIQKSQPKSSFHDIVDAKPSRKEVLKYIKHRLNEIYTGEESD